MSEMPVVVLDPGHGGARGTQNRGSSWNRAEGPNGLLEKNVVFDLAVRVAARLRDQARVELTRGPEANPSLAERAEVAKKLNAALFLSLHLNGSSDSSLDGTDVYVAHDANAAARAFGSDVWRRLRTVTGATRGGVGVRDFGMLLSARHSPSTASCLAEIAYLTNPRQAAAFTDESYRNHIADALADAIREHVRPRAIAAELGAGDGSPFLKDALKNCWAKCEELRSGASNSNAPNVAIAKRVRTETGVRLDVNPFFGIGENEIEAVIRAGFSARSAPEVLLALWAKEGSTRSVTAPVAISQATTDAHARTLFRCKVYYEDMGLDHFIVTTSAGSGSDNVYDDSDGAAPKHETHFAAKVAELVTAKFLQEDIAGAINAELTVTQANGRRAVKPSTRFYALSLLLADAFWAQLLATKHDLLPSISDGMNYMQWNMRASSFAAFLRSAETHRKEPRHKVNGQPIAIDQWALHTTPRGTEYKQPRINAIKFAAYIECYRPIFAGSLNLIKPGAEDKQKAPAATTKSLAWDDEGAPVETLGIPTFANHTLLPVGPDWKPMPIVIDEINGVFGASSTATTVLTTEADIRSSTKIPNGSRIAADPASATNFFEVDLTDIALDTVLLRATGGTVEASLRSLICYPADPADPTKLAASPKPFPVAIIVHGNHQAVTGYTATATGAPVTVPGTSPPITVTPGRIRANGSFDNHTGYSGGAGGYLQEELAKYGVVSMSVSTNGANALDLNLTMRANYIMKYLDQLQGFAGTKGHPLYNKLDFKRVALIGHSRGGDAVITALLQNAARPKATRYGIQSVVSISPSDLSGILPPAQRQAVEIGHGAHYLVVYGSHDGDISGSGDGAHDLGGSGFRLYDRSNTHRAMVYIHGANHNQFNRNWVPDEAPATIGPAVQRALAMEYVVGWIRFTMLSDWPQANLFTGATANASKTPVSLMWKFGRDLKTIERYQDTDATKNTLTGKVTKPAYVSEVEFDTQNDADAACVLPSPWPAGSACALPTFPHVDRVSKATAVSGTRAALREEIPGPHQDAHLFTHLTFRVTKKYPMTGKGPAITGAPFPDFSITLEDTAGKRKTVPSAAVQSANPQKVKPIYREFSEFAVTDRNITKYPFETWSVPLSLFTKGSDAVTLTGIRAVEFDFNATANQPIYVDTISLVRL